MLNRCQLPRLFSSRFWILPAEGSVFARFILSFFSQEAFLEAKKGSPSTVKSWKRPLSMSVILGGTFESWNDVSVLLSARLMEFCGDSVVSRLQPGAPGFTCISLLLFLRVRGPVVRSGGSSRPWCALSRAWTHPPVLGLLGPSSREPAPVPLVRSLSGGFLVGSVWLAPGVRMIWAQGLAPSPKLRDLGQGT